MTSSKTAQSALPRLRQVALAAHDLGEVGAALQEAFGWAEPFHDPGVAEFGLANAVFAAGDTFVEVVSPTRDGTTAGRYMKRRGGDTGYMAIFQVSDLAEARRRIAEAGIRVVWKVDFPDIAGTHLHPKDVPGAIVSIDWADPPQSWRWAGPRWTGTAPEHVGGGIAGITIEVGNPFEAARRWSAALGVNAREDRSGALIRLEAADQLLRFVPTPEGSPEGITEVILSGGAVGQKEIGGVRFVNPTEEEGRSDHS